MASQTIDILCGQCGAFMLRYQKKGSGQLTKLYLDRITEPNSLARLKSITRKSELPALSCMECGNRIGLAHEGGTYRMIKGSFGRKGGK
jgi:hypothetical protein